jgi:hypothetical protein
VASKEAFHAEAAAAAAAIERKKGEQNALIDAAPAWYKVVRR